MKSKSGFDAQTFDLPEPTAEDLAALERADQHDQMSPDEYLQFLLAVTRNLPAREREEAWPERFEL